MCIDLQMLSAYMDGELKEPYRTQVEEHLEHCATCRNILGNMKSLDRTIQSDSFSNSEIERNKDVIFKKLDNKFFSNGNKISFFRRRIQMKVPTAIASAAAATFIFVGAFVLFGTNSSETSDILPSFNVNAESENVRYVSNKESLDNYSLEEILQYLDSKGYNVDISIKGLQPLEVTELTQPDEGSVN